MEMRLRDWMTTAKTRDLACFNDDVDDGDVEDSAEEDWIAEETSDLELGTADVISLDERTCDDRPDGETLSDDEPA